MPTNVPQNFWQRLWNLFRPQPIQQKSIAEKLALAVDRAPRRLLKEGHHPDFNYLRVTDVAEVFYGCLREQGLSLTPNDLECWVSPDGQNAWVKTEFTVTDGKFSDYWMGFGQGRSSGGHALHIAQTTALKSWLKRLGMTFGVEDDQEAAELTPAEALGRADRPLMADVSEIMLRPSAPDYAAPEPLPIDERIEQATEENAERREARDAAANRGWNAHCHKFGKSVARRRAYLRDVWQVKEFANLPTAEAAAQALDWAEKPEELLDQLKASVTDVRAVQEEASRMTGEAQPIISALEGNPDEPFNGQF